VGVVGVEEIFMGSEQAALVEHGLFGRLVRPAHERFPGSLVKGLSVSTIRRTIVVVVVSPQRTRLRSQYWLNDAAPEADRWCVAWQLRDLPLTTELIEERERSATADAITSVPPKDEEL